MRKWKLSKDDPRANRQGLPEPIRIEVKLIHGEMIRVKIYAPAFSPHAVKEVGSSDPKTEIQIHNLFGDKLSTVWTGEKLF